MKSKITLIAVTLSLGFLLVAGCSQQGDVSQEEQGDTAYKDTIEESWAKLEADNEHWQEINEQYAPEIRTLADGTKVQRTPSEYHMYQSTKAFREGISYNNYYLDADNRGCGACHEDLADTLKNMDYPHNSVWNDALGTCITVDQCMLCHSEDDDWEMGTLMHGIHYGERCVEAFENKGGTCNSCHNMTEGYDAAANNPAPRIELWDDVKYKHMWGVTKVKNVEGEFSFDQTTTTAPEDMFTYDWLYSDYDHIMHIMGKNDLNKQLPQEFIDNWEIKVEGSVGEPYTIKLKDLIAEAEAEGATVTKLSKMHCLDNMPGGGGISNVEITGIPLSWLAEKAGGINEDTTGVMFMRRELSEPIDQQNTHSSMTGVPVSKFDDVYLVYEIGGKPLDVTSGSPCINWIEGDDAEAFVKQMPGYIFTNEDKPYEKWAHTGFNTYGMGPYINKPNATILKVPEGKIIETGKPFTFEGYADAFDQTVCKLEFSMDMGKTWTAFDLGHTDLRQWVYWHFTWTPETDGSYVLMVRATTEEGLVSVSDHKVMVTAKSNLGD